MNLSNIIVTAKGAFKPGLAVRLKFGMSKKNDYFYTVFLDSEGEAQVDKNDLLQSFDEDRKMFGMDYCDPRQFFTGQIESHILTKDEIEKQIAGNERDKKNLKYYRTLIFPTGYWENLENALAINPQGGCAVTLTVTRQSITNSGK